MGEMATYRELLAQVKSEIDEVRAAEALERHGSAVFVDVRERDEWDEGIVPGAIHIPRGNLESRIEGLVPDRSTELVLYCSAGSRSAFAAKALDELGYANVTSLIRRLHRLEAQRLPDRDAEQPDARTSAAGTHGIC